MIVNLRKTHHIINNYILHNLINRLIFNSHKRFKGSKTKAVKWLRFITKSYSNLFYHLEFEVQTGLNLFRLYRLYNKSRMNREVHVRFCERFRGEIPLYLLDCGFFYLFCVVQFAFNLYL